MLLALYPCFCRSTSSFLKEVQNPLLIVRCGIKGGMSVSSIHVQTKIGSFIQLLGDLHGSVRIQNTVLKHTKGKDRTLDLINLRFDVKALRLLCENDKAFQVLVRHCSCRCDQSLPVLIKQGRRVNFFPKSKVQAFPVSSPGFDIKP